MRSPVMNRLSQKSWAALSLSAAEACNKLMFFPETGKTHAEKPNQSKSLSKERPCPLQQPRHCIEEVSVAMATEGEKTGHGDGDRPEQDTNIPVTETQPYEEFRNMFAECWDSRVAHDVLEGHFGPVTVSLLHLGPGHATGDEAVDEFFNYKYEHSMQCNNQQVTRVPLANIDVFGCLSNWRADMHKAQHAIESLVGDPAGKAATVLRERRPVGEYCVAMAFFTAKTTISMSPSSKLSENGNIVNEASMKETESCPVRKPRIVILEPGITSFRFLAQLLHSEKVAKIVCGARPLYSLVLAAVGSEVLPCVHRVEDVLLRALLVTASKSKNCEEAQRKRTELGHTLIEQLAAASCAFTTSFAASEADEGLRECSSCPPIVFPQGVLPSRFSLMSSGTERTGTGGQIGFAGEEDHNERQRSLLRRLNDNSNHQPHVDNIAVLALMLGGWMVNEVYCQSCGLLRDPSCLDETTPGSSHQVVPAAVAADFACALMSHHGVCVDRNRLQEIAGAEVIKEHSQTAKSLLQHVKSLRTTRGDGHKRDRNDVEVTTSDASQDVRSLPSSDLNLHLATIHCEFDIKHFTTGRIFSRRPNLQGLPKNSSTATTMQNSVEKVNDVVSAQDGASQRMQTQSVRSAIIAPPGTLLVSFDYSAIELRVLAQLANDEKLLEIFCEFERDTKDKDIFHMISDRISRVFHNVGDTGPKAIGEEKSVMLPVDDVPRSNTQGQHFKNNQREQIKILMYGWLYGIGDQRLEGLLQKLACKSEAAAVSQNACVLPKWTPQSFRRALQLAFPASYHYISTIASVAASPDCLARTALGRQCQIAAAQNRHHSAAHRQLVAHLIQGTAADLLKMALLAISDLTHLQGHQSVAAKPHFGAGATPPYVLLLSIHDELVFAVRADAVEFTIKSIATAMCNVGNRLVSLSSTDNGSAGGHNQWRVPLIVKASVGPSLGELVTHSLHSSYRG